MIEQYMDFWLAKYAIDILIAGIVLAGYLIIKMVD